MADIKIASPTATAAKTPAGPLGSFFSKFMVLKGAVRELWLVFGLKLFNILAFAVMNSTLVLWLSSDLHFNDVQAGLFVTAWSAVMTLFTVFVGSVTDAIGLRRAFMLGASICLISRCFMTFTTIPFIALAIGLLPLAIGEALMTPVMVAAIRRYSTTSQRSISFSIFYVMMNVGFGLAAWILDYVRQWVGEYNQFTVPGLGMDLSAYRTLFLVSLVLSIPCVVIVRLWLREGVEATDHGVEIAVEKPKYPGAGMLEGLKLTIIDACRDTVRIFAGLWKQPGFYKFLAFLAFAAFMKLIFIHMYYTYPKFGIRELGEGAPIGRLWSINAMLIILLVPIVGALTQRIPAYTMAMVGSLIAASSVFIMALPPQALQPLADGRLGHAVANVWLGGYSRFSVDDFREIPSFAKKLEAAPDGISVTVKESLSPRTRALLQRELAAGYFNPSTRPFPSSAWFADEQIADFPGLIEKLRKDSDPATQPVSQWIWSSHFSAEFKTMVDNPATTLEARKAKFMEEMNTLLQKKEFYDKARFAGAKLSEGANAMIGQKQTLVLNRLLLEDVYPTHIARSEHPLRLGLAEDFTKLIAGKSLFEQERFAKVSLSEATKELQKSDDIVRLNRMLLEDAFPQELAKNRVGVAGSVSPYYVIIFLYVVLLSLGEAIYSPRLYEYAAAIAPKGQEASYMALSYLPFFVGKLFVAAFSGVLLARYCPPTGARHSDTLWLIIAVITFIAPAGLFLFRRYIRVKEAGREE